MRLKHTLVTIVLLVLIWALCAVSAAEAGLVLTDTQQVPDNRLFRSGYTADRFAGKIIMSDIRGSRVSSKPWIAFYCLSSEGKKVKFGLEFAEGNIQVYALYNGGTHKGLLDRKYLLQETLTDPKNWTYTGAFAIEADGTQAVVTLGDKTYVWPGITALTGEMDVGRVSGKLEVYKYGQLEEIVKKEK